MKDYKIVQSDNKQEFESLVNTALKDGYNLIGGVSIVVVPIKEGKFVTGYYQSVAK